MTTTELVPAEGPAAFAYLDDENPDACCFLGELGGPPSSAISLWTTRDPKQARAWQDALRAGRPPLVSRPTAIYSPDQPFTP